jgi:hypothetical protein
MKQQEVFKKIGTIIKELNEQYDYLETTEGQLNDLELELFVANAHFLADHSEVLRKLNSINTPPPVIIPKQPEAQKEEKYFEPVVQQVKSPEETEPEFTETPASLHSESPAEPIHEELTETHTEYTPAPHIDLQSNGADDDFSYIRQEPETIRHELTLEDIPNWEDEDDDGFVSEELTDTEEEEPVEEATVIEEPVAEKIVEIPPAEPEPVKKEPVQPVKEKQPVEAKATDTLEEPLTINQRMSAQLSNAGTRVTEQLHAQPITDLKSAITLNDKLLYIKDLFNGYNLAYSEAIEILNRLSTFEEADKFLQNSYAVKNSWESKQATADKFYSLLKRRYA